MKSTALGPLYCSHFLPCQLCKLRMMFLFVSQFICCKMVDLAQMNTWCTAPPISPRAVNTVARAAFEGEPWEVGGEKWKHLSGFIFLLRYLTSDQQWHRLCQNDWTLENKAKFFFFFKYLKKERKTLEQMLPSLHFKHITGSGTTSCARQKNTKLVGKNLSDLWITLAALSRRNQRWQAVYRRVIRGFENALQKQTQPRKSRPDDVAANYPSQIDSDPADITGKTLSTCWLWFWADSCWNGPRSRSSKRQKEENFTEPERPSFTLTTVIDG